MSAIRGFPFSADFRQGRPVEAQISLFSLIRVAGTSKDTNRFIITFTCIYYALKKLEMFVCLHVANFKSSTLLIASDKRTDSMGI